MIYIYHIYIYMYIYIYIYIFQITVRTNTTLVWYSEFHASGYSTTFKRILLTKGNSQYNGFL